MNAIPSLRIANAEGVPGTVAALVRGTGSGSDGGPLLLANHHVVFGDGAVAGDRVWAIPDDDGEPVLLGRALRGQLGRVTFAAETHFVDCALVALVDCASLPRWIRDALDALAQRRSIARAHSGLPVHKSGPATGQTRGRIVHVDYPDYPRIEGKSWQAPRQLLVESADTAIRFCGAGDSGSALLAEDERIVGLLWGSTGSGQGIASPIEPVLDCLAVSLEGGVDGH